MVRISKSKDRLLKTALKGIDKSHMLLGFGVGATVLGEM